MEFLILDIEKSKKDSVYTWFAPMAKGYTSDVKKAGRFTEDIVKKVWRDVDGEVVKLVPESEVEKLYKMEVVYRSQDTKEVFGF